MSGFCNVCVCEGFVMCFWSYVYRTVTEVFLNLTEVFLTLTEVFPRFFLSCKTNARVKLAKTGHGTHSSTLVSICVVRLLFVLFYVLFVCKCVLPPGDNSTVVNKYIKISNIYIYLGRYLPNQNTIREEIKGRLKLGNACYHSVQNLSSSLLSKNLKTEIYRTLILTEVLCGCETWSLTFREGVG